MTHAFLYFLSLLAARTAIIFIAMIVGMRLLGKRQTGQMNLYDLAVVMALANAIQNAMTAGKGDLSVGIVCAGTLFAMGRVLTRLFVRAPRIEQFVCGTPTVLISDGKVNEAKMRREAVTPEQLLATLHQHGLTAPSQVALAVLEVDGTLSIVPKKDPASGGKE